MLRQMFQKGVVISGSSAGTDIQQGAPMITGGESFEALLYGAPGFPLFSSLQRI